MNMSSFGNFYSKFFCLASDLEYTSEILIWEFIHKLTSQLQNQLNSSVKFPTLISVLVKWCLFIYDQIQAKDKIRDRTKSLQLIPTLAFTSSNNKHYQVLVTNTHVNTCTNTLFSRLSSSITGTLTLTS